VKGLGTTPAGPSLGGNLIALAVGLVFAAVAAWVYATVLGIGAFQQDVRDAQVARATVMKGLLDEETGVRGYASTLDKQFLRPYEQAAPQMEKRLDDEASTLAKLDGAVPAGSGAAVTDERTAHRLWLKSVAQPLLASPRRPDAGRLQIDGKALVDRMRDDNDAINATLVGASEQADAAFAATQQRIFAIGLVGALVAFVLGNVLVRRAETLRRDLERQRLLYENEKRVADTLQNAFLQLKLPEVPTVAMHAVYKPAKEQSLVGGDWYGAFLLPNGKIFVTIGDVSGHGIGAAVSMARARMACVALATAGADPAQVLERANEALLVYGPAIVTTVCGYVDPRTFEFVYSTAGHPPPVLAERSAPARFLPHDGLPLGVDPHARYRTFVARPSSGSMVVLYTDGLIEYDRDLAGGEARLLEAAARAANAGTGDAAAAICEDILGGRAPGDDVALLTIQLAPLGSVAEEVRHDRREREKIEA
jgi:hypothetical protein